MRILIDTAAMGNSSEFSLEMKRLRTEGMSAEEAWRQTFTDYVERVVDTGVRSGRYGLIAGLSEYGGAYFEQHPEAFNALVNEKTGWSGGMRDLQPGGAQGLLGLPGDTLAPGGRMGGMPMLPGPVAVKDDWETALEEAVEEQGVGDPEDVDISGENGIIIGRSVGAKGKNYGVVDPGSGRTYRFAEGSHLQNVEVFAGGRSGTSLHDGVAEGLTSQYGGQTERWQHVKGVGYVDVDGEEIRVEVHWFQEPSVGKVKFNIKKWFYDG